MGGLLAKVQARLGPARGWLAGLAVAVFWRAIVLRRNGAVLRLLRAQGREGGDVAWVGALAVGLAVAAAQARQRSAVAAAAGSVLSWFCFLDDALLMPDGRELVEQLKRDTEEQSVAVGGNADDVTCTPARRLRGFEGGLLRTHADCGADVRTIKDLLDRAERLFSSRTLCLTRRVRSDGSFAEYQPRSYKAFLRDVQLCARRLQSGAQGPRRLPRLGIFAKNCEEYGVAVFAALGSGVTVVPLYATLGSTAIRHIVHHAELTTVCVSEENLELLLRLKSAASVDASVDAAAPANPATVCEALETVYVFKDRTIPEASPEHVNRGPRRFMGLRILPFESLLTEELSESSSESDVEFDANTDANTDADADADADAVSRRVLPLAAPGPDDLAFILYTSGTTSMPKGVLLTHGGILASSSGLSTAVTVRADDVHLSYLPMAHAFEVAVIVAGLMHGASVGWYHGNVKELTEDAVALRPTLFIGVPRVFQRVQQVINQKFMLKPAPIRWLCHRAVRAQALHVRATGGRRLWLYDQLVFSQVKQALGGRVRIMCSGSAPLAPSIQEFIKVCFDVPMVEGYGMTETSGVSHAMLGGYQGSFDPTVGHVGPALGCSEFRLQSAPELGYTIHDEEGPRGEVQLRGPNIFRGYFKDPALTAEALQDGWLKTGDIGRLNANGTLSIVDRIKNIFKLAQGEYVAAEKLENMLMNVPVVGQIFVYGNSFESMLVAVVVPDPQELLPRIKRGAIPGIVEADIPVLSTDLDSWLGPYHELCCHLRFGPLIRDFVMAEIRAACVRAELAGFEYVRAVHVESKINKLLQGFSEENGMLTPTFKGRRNKIEEHYKSEIDRMYQELNA